MLSIQSSTLKQKYPIFFHLLQNSNISSSFLFKNEANAKFNFFIEFINNLLDDKHHADNVYHNHIINNLTNIEFILNNNSDIQKLLNVIKLNNLQLEFKINQLYDLEFFIRLSVDWKQSESIDLMTIKLFTPLNILSDIIVVSPETLLDNFIDFHPSYLDFNLHQITFNTPDIDVNNTQLSHKTNEFFTTIEYPVIPTYMPLSYEKTYLNHIEMLKWATECKINAQIIMENISDNKWFYYLIKTMDNIITITNSPLNKDFCFYIFLNKYQNDKLFLEIGVELLLETTLQNAWNSTLKSINLNDYSYAHNHVNAPKKINIELLSLNLNKKDDLFYLLVDTDKQSNSVIWEMQQTGHLFNCLDDESKKHWLTQLGKLFIQNYGDNLNTTTLKNVLKLFKENWIKSYGYSIFYNNELANVEKDSYFNEDELTSTVKGIRIIMDNLNLNNIDVHSDEFESLINRNSIANGLVNIYNSNDLFNQEWLDILPLEFCYKLTNGNYLVFILKLNNENLYQLSKEGLPLSFYLFNEYLMRESAMSNGFYDDY